MFSSIASHEVHEVAAVLDETSFFDIGIRAQEESDTPHVDEEEEEIVIPIVQKRQRTANTMIGGVRKGKYSTC